MRAHPGEVVPFPLDTTRDDPVPPIGTHPTRVAILSDRGVVSVCEAFLLRTRPCGWAQPGGHPARRDHRPPAWGDWIRFALDQLEGSTAATGAGRQGAALGVLLDLGQFARIRRATAVNLRPTREMQPWISGGRIRGSGPRERRIP